MRNPQEKIGGVAPSTAMVPATAAPRMGVARGGAMSPLVLRVFEEVSKRYRIDKTNVDADEQPKVGCVEVIIDAVCGAYGVMLTPYERDLIAREIARAEAPFGPLQLLVDDLSVSDILVTAWNQIAIQQGRKTVQTGVSFPTEQSYLAFVERMMLLADTSLSLRHPIADGMIGEAARIHAVHQSLCERGPYLTIRLNRFSTVGSLELVRTGMIPHEMRSYLATLCKGGVTMLIAGEVGTGKTTLLRALAAEIADDESILVVEDTPEIRLKNKHCRYITTREDNAEQEGRVSPSQCIRAGMRMAMNRIIFGEIRDAEAAESFIDVCASGHPGMSTIHARSAADALARLELFLGRIQRGAERSVFLDQISRAIGVVVHCGTCQRTGYRRVLEVREIGAAADGVIRQRPVFRYAMVEEQPAWIVEGKVSLYRELLNRSAGVELNTLPNYLVPDSQ